MSLGRPDRGSVDDKERLLQILTGLYDAINGNRTAITQLEQRFISVTDASTTINAGASTSTAVSPLADAGGEDGGVWEGPLPGSDRLVFSTGLTRSGDVITANLSTGIPGGQSVVGGTGASENLTYSSTTDGSKGLHVWGTTSKMYFDEASGNLILGTTTPFSGSAVEVVRNFNGAVAFAFVNQNTGTNAYTAFFLAQSPTFASGCTFGTFLFSSGSGYGLPYGANVGLFELAGGSGNMHFWIQQNAGDFVWYTKPTFPGPPERMRIASGGNVSIANLAAGGVVYATAATGVLKIGTSAEVAGAITWPAAGRVLVSTGTTTAPAGDANVLLDTTAHEFYITQPGYQSWYNATGANYERVRASWGTWSVSGTTAWMLASEKAAAGTVRDLAIDAGVANAYLFGAVATMYGTNTSNRVTISGVLGAEIGASFSVARSASATLDAIQLTNPTAFSITGAAGTNITTATGFNFIRVARPTYDGGGNATTITNAAAVYITNAPLAQNGVTITNNYALWVDDGFVRMDGSASVAAGSGGGMLGINGAATASNYSLSVGNNNDSTRDHVAIFVGGGALYDHPNNSFVHVSPTSTSIAGADFGGTGILATVRIDSLTYSALSGSPSITGAAALYIPSAPSLSGVTGATYAIWVDAGVCRLDGQVALGGGAAATLGTIGGSGPGTAAQNKWLPINSDGTTYYVPLWV